MIPGLATFVEALMVWRISQRIYLELAARVTWMLSVKPTFQVASSWEVAPLSGVVGAVTDRLDMAKYLYRVSVCIIFGDWLFY